MVKRIPFYAFLVAATGFIAVPIYWLVLSSFRPTSQLGDPALIPSSVTLANYISALADTQVPRWMLNTFIIAAGTTVLGLLVSSLAAYSFARHDFAGKRPLFAIIIASIALPEYVTVIPAFVIMRELHLLNTYFAVILPLAGHALALFLLRQYFRQLPDELFDAARADGASEWRIYWTLTLPLIRPGLGAAGLILFLSAWNSYLLPLIMLRDPDLFTMPLGLGFVYSTLLGSRAGFDPWAVITAGTVLSALPLIICLLVMQRQFISGLTQGAVK